MTQTTEISNSQRRVAKKLLFVAERVGFCEAGEFRINADLSFTDSSGERWSYAELLRDVHEHLVDA